MKNNLTPYEQWQKDVYGNILQPIENTKDEYLFESGIEELNRLTEWIEYLDNLELMDYE